MTLPHQLLASLRRADATAPRATCYDDATGERIELSARVLATWNAKAATLLAEDADVSPDSTVGIALPAHWRALYWALATWSTGACLVTGPDAAAADVVVTDDPALAATVVQDGRYAVLVTLAALARSNPDTPVGVVDEAAELAGYPDDFVALAEPMPDDPGWARGGDHTAYRDLVDPGHVSTGSRVRVPDVLDAFLSGTLAAWASGGSVVLIRNANGDQAHRLAAERVHLDLTE